jgi:hypothetical protein
MIERRHANGSKTINGRWTQGCPFREEIMPRTPFIGTSIAQISSAADGIESGEQASIQEMDFLLYNGLSRSRASPRRVSSAT